MVSTIYLYNQFLLQTHKVYNKIVYYMLTFKFYSKSSAT